MTAFLRAARLEDVPQLLAFMREFYAESQYTLDTERAQIVFTQLLADERLGRVWLVEQDRSTVGYVVVAFVFSMEYGGLNAVVDDLFIQPTSRHQGLGRTAISQVIESCRAQGVRALHLETEAANGAAMRLYRRAGFRESGRQLMTLRLEAPLHIEEPTPRS